jgi:sugar lactone lactonase YvrE
LTPSPNTLPTPQLVLDLRCELAEGPCWDPHRHVLWWVNIVAGEVHCFDPATGQDRVYPAGENVCLARPRARGGLLLGLERGLAVLDPESGAIERLSEAPEPAGNRFNDGACDPAGRLLIGSLAKDGAEHAGALYRVGPDLGFTRLLGGLTCSNGLVWSGDGHILYYIDTATRQIAAYDYDVRIGSLAGQRIAVQVPEGLGWPDGMTIDAEGMLWVGQWGGGCVARYDPQSGELLARVELPVSQVSSCCFGGPDLRDLYITTAWEHLSAEQREREPLAGGVFRVRPGVSGLPSIDFAG